MDFISPIVTPIVESLMVPIKKHIGYLVHSTKNVTEMGDKMEQLNVAAQDIQETKDATVAKDQVLPKEVPKWLEDAKKMNEMALSIPTGGIGCFNLAARYKAGKKSSDIIKKIDDLKTRKSEIKWTNEQKPLGRVRSTCTSSPGHDVNQIRFNSRDLIFKDALKCLEPYNETRKMALCGMGGVGKTTMMEQLKKAVEDSKMFDWVVKVVIGENTDPIVLQQAIAEKMGEPLTETTKDARADRLHRRFVGMSQNGQKKILVIMDDVWKEVDLKDVGLRSPLPNGVKLLFTSRFEYVCTQMGVQTDSIFKVGLLNDEEAKSFFFEIVGRSVCDDPELQKTGEDIVKECRGLPIAIKTIANTLRDDIKDAWKEALYHLQHDDLQDLEDIVQKVFEMSYNNLKNDDDKAVFLLSGIYPDDFNIPIEDLIRYGWGLKLFNKVHTLAEARRRANTCVNRLIRANLLTESDLMGCFKMHDLVRAFVLSNFSKVKQASIVNHDNMSGRLTEDANESYDRILLKCTGMVEFPADFNYPNLSFFKLMNGNKLREFPNDFHEGMSKLEVVSYEDMHTRLFPPAFQHPTKLRTVCLRSCSLMDDFAFLGSLRNLETLSFADCKINMLPSMIGNLKRLKLLDLTGCVELCIDDGVFQKLDRLEELYMKTFESSSIRFTDANCDELEITSKRLSALELEFFKNKARPNNVSFKKLERFRISIGRELEDREYYSFRNTLNLVADCNELQECEISELFEKTEELYLQVNDMNGLSDVSMHPSQLSFSNLRDLHVAECAELTYLFTIPVASGLKKLERLKISGCPKLVSLCDTISVDVIELPQLVELILDGLPSITGIYPDNNDNASAMQSFLSKEVVIPKLEKLKISKMEKLKQIWPCHITSAEKNNVSMLKQIEVRECESLVNLFPNNPFPLLNHLEELEVRNCGAIEVLFNIDLEGVCEMAEGNIISRLRKIQVRDSGNVRELWRMNNSEEEEDILLVNSFKAVESIRIVGCERFEYIFTPTTTNFNLGALTTYHVIKPRKEMETDIEEINVRSKEEISEITDSIPKVTYISHLRHACHHLQHLGLEGDKRVEVVFEMDSRPIGRELPPIQETQQPQPFPSYLEFLQLESLENMSHVWKCNWNNFLLIPRQPPMEFPFHNLKEIRLWHCDKIKYLFSPLMAKCLSNLKTVWIRGCDGMEEVVSSRDDDEITSSHTNTTTTTLFPHFDSLHLENLKCLKRIDGGDASSRSDQFQGAQVIRASWSLCQYPKEIWVQGCDALSSLIPWYAAEQMKRLEDLFMFDCNSMIEVFESGQLINNIANVDEGSECGATATSPTLIIIPQLSNLKTVEISDCNHLLYVFTFSTLESLKQLTSLTISKCNDIKVIVKEENGEQTTASKVVLFPRLEKLKLLNLPNLQGFLLGMNDFHWPSLNKLKISDCSKMEGFTCGPSKTPNLKYISSRLGKHILDQTCLDPCSFHNLVQLSIYGQRLDEEEEYLIPSNALEQLGKLEKIYLSHRKGGKEGVFEVAALELKQGTNNNINSGFNDHQSPAPTVVKNIPIPNLREMELRVLMDLRYIWKSNPWMVLEFPNLTTVSIHHCNNLEHVFTCSMVGSLVHLQDLYIQGCKKLEVIVKRDELEEEEEECDDANVINEIIVLPGLKSLKLESLPRLKGFCLGKEAFSLPKLDTLKIKYCPTFTVFNAGRLETPELKVINTNNGMYHVKEDLNSLIKVKQQENPIKFGTDNNWNHFGPSDYFYLAISNCYFSIHCCCFDKEIEVGYCFVVFVYQLIWVTVGYIGCFSDGPFKLLTGSSFGSFCPSDIWLIYYLIRGCEAFQSVFSVLDGVCHQLFFSFHRPVYRV